jgi:hypothetical protein
VKKNKEPQLIKLALLIMPSNKNIIDEAYLENKDFIINRLKVIHFSIPISEENMDYNIKEKIKNEEAKIIILCNKIYFNFLKNKRNNLINKKKQACFFLFWRFIEKFMFSCLFFL